MVGQTKRLRERTQETRSTKEAESQGGPDKNMRREKPRKTKNTKEAGARTKQELRREKARTMKNTQEAEAQRWARQEDEKRELTSWFEGRPGSKENPQWRRQGRRK